MENYKSLIEHCAQVDPILHILPELFRGIEQAALGCAVRSDMREL